MIGLTLYIWTDGEMGASWLKIALAKTRYEGAKNLPSSRIYAM